jgi:exosortase/archaeosortase family protein
MPAATPALLNRFTWSWISSRLVIFGPAAFLLICRFHEAAIDMDSLPDRDVLHAMHIDAFQVLAWGVAFCLLGRLGSPRWPNAVDIAGALIVCAVGSLSSAAGLATLALLLTLTACGDVGRLAAATVFAALFFQQAIMPLVFDLLWPTLTQFDTMLVGSIVKLTISGATWQGNIISVPGDHSIEIVAGCCSFRNVSLAALCWVALTKLERPQWRRLDIVVLAAAAGCQIALNIVRIYLMALSDDMYLYWHTGMGAHIFAITASFGAVLISAFGARWVSLRSGCVIALKSQRNRPQ